MLLGQVEDRIALATDPHVIDNLVAIVASLRIDQILQRLFVRVVELFNQNVKADLSRWHEYGALGQIKLFF